MNLTHEDLQRELDDLGSHFPKLNKEDLFVLWFMRAYLTDNLEVAASSVCNGKCDKGVDAVLIDDAAKAVFIVQGKYRETIGKKSEGRSDVLAFASIAHPLLSDSKEDLKDLLKDCDPLVTQKLTAARRKVGQGYRLWLYYITLGTCSQSLRAESYSVVRKGHNNAQIAILDASRVMTLLRDYLDGVAPPIPVLDLEMEAGSGVSVAGIMQRYERGNEIESWVFPMRGDAVASLFEIGNVRLFARNIRGFLGSDTEVNRGMEATLEKEPEKFFL